MGNSRFGGTLSTASNLLFQVAPNGRHVCYCYIPTRAIWHHDQYFSGGFAGRAFGMLLPMLKRHELEAVAHTDEFIAISEMEKCEGFMTRLIRHCVN